MRDILTDFGTVKTAASAADTEFTNGVDAGEGGNLGRLCNVFVRVKVEGSVAVPASEILTFTVKHKEDSGAGTALMTYARPAGALAVGEDFSFPLPKDHLRYLSLSAKSSATANIQLHAWLEEGEKK